MKKHRCWLAALILGASGWVGASVPMIELDQARLSELRAVTLLAPKQPFLSGLGKDQAAGAELASPRAFNVSPGILRQVENMSNSTNHQVSAGSFSSDARDAAWSRPSSAPYFGPGAEPGSILDGHRAGVMVAAPAMPKAWAILLLALGCVLYQGRQAGRRRRPFGARTFD